MSDGAAETGRGPFVLAGNSIGSQVALMAAAELAARQKRPAGCFLMNCAGGMNQKGLMADDWRLVLASPFFALIEAILQSPLAAGYFRNFATDRNVRTILQKQARRSPPPRGVRGCVGYRRARRCRCT